MLGILLLLVFIFTMTVVLLNTLIAIMSEAASNVRLPLHSHLEGTAGVSDTPVCGLRPARGA